jgi:hypothetical protein
MYMAKTAKRQLKKNNTKKMKGGGWLMDTFNKITGRQQLTSNDDPNILDQKSLNTERNKPKPVAGPLTEITAPTPTFNGGRRRKTKKATRKAKKGGRIAKKGARKANKSRRTRK